MYGIGAWTRRPRLSVVCVMYWGTDYTITSIGRVYKVLEYGLDEHVSW